MVSAPMGMLALLAVTSVYGSLSDNGSSSQQLVAVQVKIDQKIAGASFDRVEAAAGRFGMSAWRLIVRVGRGCAIAIGDIVAERLFSLYGNASSTRVAHIPSVYCQVPLGETVNGDDGDSAWRHIVKERRAHVTSCHPSPLATAHGLLHHYMRGQCLCSSLLL